MSDPRIEIAPNGPYVVDGELPLQRTSIVTSEHGESLTWKRGESLEAGGSYALCRCGGSSDKPFCDGTHNNNGFASDRSITDTYDDRAETLGGTNVTVRDDRSICAHAAFCGNRVTNVWKQVPKTDDSVVRSQVIAEVERCPSGALTYLIDGDQVDAAKPAAIEVVDDGPLWVTGGVDIVNPDGSPMETRNRVTMCRCGQSSNKPLCDGSHAKVGFEDH
jgi:CDGSH-type Zn-finger protein